MIPPIFRCVRQRPPIRFLSSLFVMLGAVSATAQSSYEIIEAKLPEALPGKTFVQFLNNSGQIAGFVRDANNNRTGNFIARWEPGNTQLTAVQFFPGNLFSAPPGYTTTGWGWAAFFDNGEAYAVVTGQRDLNPVFESHPAGFEAHPANGLLNRYKYSARILRYNGGVFTPVKEFESFHPTGQILSSGQNMVRFIDHEFGGDGDTSRYPRADEWFTYDPQLPHYPEIFTMHDPAGGSTPLSTDIDVLSLPGDYRYLTHFMGMDDNGNLYGRASFRTHPLTSFGRPYTRTTYEVWVNGAPRRLADFAPPWGQSLALENVNGGGEISGTYGTIGIFGGTVGGRLAIYLPRPNYGMNAGIHTLTNTGDPAPTSVSRLNRQGALVWGTANAIAGSLWSGGVHTTLNSLVAPGSTPQVLNGNQALLNDLGWICTQGRNPDQNGPADIRQWLMRPAFTAEASLSAERLFVGETFNFTLRVHNMTDTPRTLGLPIGFRFSGDAQFQLVGASTPPGTRVVPAFGSFEVRQEIMATNAGTSTWRSQGRLFSGGTSNDTAVAYTGVLRVLDRADLLIKRAGEPESAYGVDNEYQSMPAGPQVRTNSVVAGETSGFNVLVQNDDDKPRTFRLKADEGLNGEGWQVRHLLNGADLSAAIRAGHVLPELAAGQSHQITLEVTGANAPPGEPKRVLYTLEEATEPGEIRDIVEAVTELGGEIIVNSTGDEPDADPLDNVADVDLDESGLQTTLRAAIELANRRAGKDVINFDIQPEGNVFENGVALIAPHTDLPAIGDTLVLDGWSQSPDSQTPPVELSGHDLQRSFSGSGGPNTGDYGGAGSGLVVDAGACEIRGLVIRHFKESGIHLRSGGGAIITGNFIGTDSTGTKPKGFLRTWQDSDATPWFRATAIRIDSSFNRIGGATHRERNILAQHGGTLVAGPDGIEEVEDNYGEAAVVDVGGAHNVIQGNWIGLSSSGDSGINPAGTSFSTNPVGIRIAGEYAVGNRIGGSGPGFGNTIADCVIGIRVGKGGTTIIGNRIGCGPLGNRKLWNLIGIDIMTDDRVTIGGTEPGEGNVISGNGIGILAIGETDLHILGNLIGLQADGVGPLGNAIGVQQYIGRGPLIERNLIAHNGETGVLLGSFYSGGFVNPVHSSIIRENQIFANGGGVSLQAHVDRMPPVSVIGESGPAALAGCGIYIVEGEGNRIHNNAIWGNRGTGIGLGGDGSPIPNDVGDYDDGPNLRQNRPINLTARLSESGLELSAALSGRLGAHTYQIDFYISEPHSSGRVDGQRLVGSAELVTSVIAGEGEVTLNVPPPHVTKSSFVTATATDSEGNTSEFSKPALVQGSTDTEADGMSDEVEQGVPNRAPQGGGPGPMSANGDGNGDGVPDGQQAHVTSFPALNGDWWTLASAASVPLAEVSPAGPPDFASLPAGYEFPVGFVSATLSGLTPGGSVTLTNILHGDLELTTVFAFGPRPGHTQPQWYQLPATIVGDEIRLNFTDGAEGDQDLSADGRISIIYAPAYLIPPGPPLTVLSHFTETVSETRPALVNGQVIPVTNQVSQVSIVLAWPVGAAGWFLESTDQLAPGSIWREVLEEPVVADGRNVVTIRSTDARRFFRLRLR